MFSRQITGKYVISAHSVEELETLAATFAAVHSQYRRVCKIPLARTCYIRIRGEYVDNGDAMNDIKRLVGGLTHIGNMMIERGEFYLSANIDDVDAADLLYEFWCVSRVLPDNAHVSAVLCDDAEFGNGCMKAVKYVVVPGKVSMHDIRREGATERIAEVQKKLNRVQSEMTILHQILTQLDDVEQPSTSWDEWVADGEGGVKLTEN